MLFSSFSEPLSTLFTFQSAPASLPPLKFKKQSHRRVPKRSRPVADVDELISESKKKRRLRLLLITSRLSRPFSTPATHIVDPGTSKIAVWAKQRHLTQQVLRKAAIMNRVRRKTLERKDSGVSVGEDERREARQAVMEGMKLELEEATVASLGPNAIQDSDSSSWSVAPSPLGLSNYDALDDDDDWFESYHEEEEGDPLPEMSKAKHADNKDDKQEKSYYSDWSIVNFRTTQKQDDDDDSDPFHLNVIPSEITHERRPPSPPEDKLIELVREKQRQREITAGFLHFP